VTVAGGNLFRVAAEQLGDATQWYRIARVNGLTDPFIQGTVTLTLPAPLSPQQSNGGVLGLPL
jgi:hypothetical protein